MTTFHLELGDCLEEMARLGDGCMDLVVTSPPYNLGIDYHAYRDNLSREAYLEWTLRWAAEVRRVLRPRGSFFLNLGASPKSPLLPHQVLLALTSGAEPLFVLQNTIHWIKSITVRQTNGEELSVGHFKPINSQRYLNDCHEYLYHLTIEGDTPLDRRAAGTPYADKSNIARWGHTGGHDLRCRGNTWFVPYKTILNRDRERPHPASFPPELVERCILLHGRGGETHLLDPFLGIGSSALAAYRQKIAHFTGCEIDAHYLEIARTRLAEEGDSQVLSSEQTAFEF